MMTPSDRKLREALEKVAEHVGPEVQNAMDWLESLPDPEAKDIMKIIDGLITLCKGFKEYAEELNGHIDQLMSDAEVH